MALDNKYGVVLDEGGKLPPDEPVFVIRGRDLLAVPVIRFYAEKAEERGSPVFGQVMDVADAIVLWQQAHPERCKLPD